MTSAAFDTIYATDLVYVPACWKLCGDAHCCSFSRHKARFKLIAQTPGQELPLLPGEYGYLDARGYLAQFGDHDHRVIEHRFGAGSRRLVVETIISRRAGCACEHATRPTICRLYPVFPVFDVDGRLVDVDRVGIYDALEALDGLPRICQVDTVPTAEWRKLLTVTTAIADDPVRVFYVMAYKIAHDHVTARLPMLKGKRPLSLFAVFEGALLRGKLFDLPALNATLDALADAFEARWGERFSLP
jgi:hypothetical protein